MDEQRWVKANIAKLTGALQGAASHAEFGQRLLSGLVPVLGGGVAVLPSGPGQGAPQDHRLLRPRRPSGPDGSVAGWRRPRGTVRARARVRRPFQPASGLPPNLLGTGRRRAAPDHCMAHHVERYAARSDRIRIVPPFRSQ
jgi:hypothetical protein